jgi:tetratricopeptide (TPR) repeat protein
MSKKKKRVEAVEKRGTPSAEKIAFLVIAVAVVAGVLLYYGLTRRSRESMQYHQGSSEVADDPEVKALMNRLEDNPNDLGALHDLGNRYYDNGNFAMAEMFYKKILELDPKDVDVIVDLGTLCYYTKRPDEAIQRYQEALEIKPDYKNALFNMGLVQNATGDLKGAIDSWNRFIEVAGDDPHIEPIKKMIESLKEKMEGGSDQ